MNFIAEAFERRLATRPDYAFLCDELTPKGVTGSRAGAAWALFTFGDIRKRL